MVEGSVGMFEGQVTLNLFIYKKRIEIGMVSSGIGNLLFDPISRGLPIPPRNMPRL